MGALPNKLPGFQDVEDDEPVPGSSATWGATSRPSGWHLTQMFEAMERGDAALVYVIGENPAQSEADVAARPPPARGLDLLVVQDIFLTRTAQLADVVLPAAATGARPRAPSPTPSGACSASARRCDPPGEARTDLDILLALAAGSDTTGAATAEASGTSCAACRRCTGDELARLEEHGGLQWPCYSEDHPGDAFLHGRLWEDDRSRARGTVHRRPSGCPPVDALDRRVPVPAHDRPPPRLVQHRRAVGGFSSPAPDLGDARHLGPDDAARLASPTATRSRSSRRGQHPRCRPASTRAACRAWCS
jgi:predicted molibdopterin-dependent oxidoreductase YjgC